MRWHLRRPGRMAPYNRPMSSILAATAPIYLLIAAGYLAVRLGVFAQGELRVLGRFAGQFCLPVLVFGVVARQGVAGVLRADYLLVYTLGSLATFGLVLLVMTRVRGRPLTPAALLALGAANSNSAFVGYPVLAQVVGPEAAIALALNALVENLVIIPLALVLADLGRHERGAGEIVGTMLKSLARNPILLGVLAGLAVALTSFSLPGFLDRAVGLVSAAAAPAALFFIGASLVGTRLGEIGPDLPLVAGAKLLLHPACVALFTLLIPMASPALRDAAILYAAAPMLSIFPVLALRFGQERLASVILLVTTLASFFSMSALIAVVGVR